MPTETYSIKNVAENIEIDSNKEELEKYKIEHMEQTSPQHSIIANYTPINWNPKILQEWKKECTELKETDMQTRHKKTQ